MNEFIEQFIIESRELVDEAGAALAILDHSPRDDQALNALLRALHTLKGSAGIIDFSVMEQLLHAMEDALGHVQSHQDAVGGKVNADCQACLDVLARWLDAMEHSGELPAEAATQCAPLLARLHDASQGIETSSIPLDGRDPSRDWLEQMLSEHADAGVNTRTAVRFTPEGASFFRGEDPLAVIAALPGLLALDLQPTGEWPTLDTFDPYESFLVFSALTAAPIHEVRQHLQAYVEDCEFLQPGSAAARSAVPALSPSAQALLEAQLALLDAMPNPMFSGCVAAAGTVAFNVLTHCGLHAAAEMAARASVQSLAEHNPAPLRASIVQALSAEADLPGAAAALPRHPERVARTLRVDIERVEMLVRLAGELTVVKNAIGHVVNLAQAEASPIAGSLKSQQEVLDRITGDMQRAVLGMRVLPLRAVFGRFPPLVRELSARAGKPVQLVIDGDGTEADKAIVELLFEPLLHVMRNAMDHGIEAPDVRARNNKPPIATLGMRASRRDDRVLIEVSDDGAGIDVARIREIAVQRGVVTSERLAELSEAEIIELVFAPGFSTVANVTELSGRGVGMDAVRTAVGRIGGAVAVESRPALGTTVTFSLPFSVMLSQVMTVEAGGQLFGIPLDAVIETLRVPVAAITGIGTAHAIAHRNRTLPIFDLGNLLQVASQAPVGDEAVIVVVAIAGQWGGLRVDRLGERMEVMLKPLDGLLSGIPGITGTTITGDGRVLLVLDTGEILR